MAQKVWILGASDPEMEMIQRILLAVGETVVYAAVDGQRVRPDSAYRADGPAVDGPCVVVECAGPIGAVVIDHHRPGDPGYGRAAADYWAASSIGQVCDLLGIAATDELRLVAAADHCLAAAYRGECPGVDPDALMAWRVASRAAFQRRDPAGLLADVEATRAALRCAPWLALRPAVVARDMRREPPWPELPEAAARENAAYVSGPLIGPDGRRKYTCAGPPEVIQAWLAGCGPAADLVDRYGDPARGFAGGYVGEEA